MFFRQKREVGPAQTHEAPVGGLSSQENPLESTRVTESIASTALASSSMSVRGFEQTDNGILIPNKLTKLTYTGNVLSTDTRRITPESVEASFQAEQERLNSPLNSSEIQGALERVELEFKKRRTEFLSGNDAGKYEHELRDRRVASITRADLDAVYIARDAIEGKEIEQDEGLIKPGEELSAREILGRVVEQFAQNPIIKISGDGSIDPSIQSLYAPKLYENLRALQIVTALETNPRGFRERVLESQEPDVSWVVNEPVVVMRQLSEAEKTV